MSLKSIDEKENQEIMARYTKVFSSEDGIWVLTDMVLNLGFFEYNQTDPATLERMNFVRFLFNRLGIFDLTKAYNLMSAFISIGAIPTKSRK